MKETKYILTMNGFIESDQGDWKVYPDARTGELRFGTDKMNLPDLSRRNKIKKT